VTDLGHFILETSYLFLLKKYKIVKSKKLIFKLKIMKKLTLLVFVLLLCCFSPKSFGQITEFPYEQGFEDPVFTEGDSIYFIPNWFGNYVDNYRIFQDNTAFRDGGTSLGLWPVAAEGEEEEEVEVFVQVNLNLTGLENVVADFWASTVATGDQKHLKLYLKVSTDGGETFGPKILMGDGELGFSNEDTQFTKYTYALHSDAFDEPNVVLQFLAKSGAKKGVPPKVLIDDITIFAADEDIYPPLVLDPSVISTTEIEVQFSEAVSTTTNLFSADNYTFLEGAFDMPIVSNVTLKASDIITLNLDPGISIGKYYELEIANIEDLAGNVMETSIAELIHNPLAEGLVITEIMYDEPPAEQEDKLEFIELFNITETPIELGGLRIKGGIASGKLPEYTLEPGAYWVTAKDAAAFSAFFGVPAFEWKGANLSNDEAELLYIENTQHHSGIVIDSLTYNIGGEWPQGAIGLGYSMELIDPLSDNSDPANWRDATDFVGIYEGVNIYASPGSAGTGILKVAEESLEKGIAMYPNPVQNVLYINSKSPLTKVEIYSLLGNKIKEVRTNLNSIETKYLSQGVYIVKVYSENGSKTMKIVKN